MFPHLIAVRRDQRILRTLDTASRSLTNDMSQHLRTSGRQGIATVATYQRTATILPHLFL